MPSKIGFNKFFKVDVSIPKNPTVNSIIFYLICVPIVPQHLVYDSDSVACYTSTPGPARAFCCASTPSVSIITMFGSQPPASVDLQTTWTFLEEGIDHLMTDSPSGSVSYAKVFNDQLGPRVLFLSNSSQHMSLTTAVFNYCSSSKPVGSLLRTRRRE